MKRIQGAYSTTTTLRFLLEPTLDQLEVLQDLTTEYTRVLNTISQLNTERLTNNIKLHHRVYYPIRESSSLNADYVCQAIKDVAGSYKALAHRTNRLNRRIDWYQLKYPTHTRVKKLTDTLIKTNTAIPTYKKYNSVALTERSLKSTPHMMCNDRVVRITTRVGIQHIQLATNNYNLKQLEHLVGCLRLRTARLVYQQGRYYVHISVEHLASIHGGRAVGIDLGQTDVLATCYGELVVPRSITQAYEARQTKHRAHIAHLQRNGSKNAKRSLRRTSGAIRRSTNNYLHVVAKHFIEDLKKIGTAVLVTEKLTGIRDTKTKKERARLSSWHHSKFLTFITYKAVKADMLVLHVHPAHTSTTCSQCGSTDTTRKGKHFQCNSCTECVSDADVNAAINIRNKVLKRDHLSYNQVNYLRSRMLVSNFKKSKTLGPQSIGL